MERARDAMQGGAADRHDARRLKETLIGKGLKPGKDSATFEAEGAEHNEEHGPPDGPILEFLFPRKAKMTRGEP